MPAPQNDYDYDYQKEVSTESESKGVRETAAVAACELAIKQHNSIENRE